MHTHSLCALESSVGHTFSDRSYIVMALTHRSSVIHKKDPTNERLEFLGDRVLGLVVADMLYRAFPEENEGDLARRFAALVSRESLARVAQCIQLDHFLILSPGEEHAGGRKKTALWANACEALIGALYMDAGLEGASSFVQRYWEPLMGEAKQPPKDFRTSLQEWAQKRGLPLPVYDVVSAEGPDHSPRFVVRVTVEGRPPQTAEGATKKEASQAAARCLLEILL